MKTHYRVEWNANPDDEELSDWEFYSKTKTLKEARADVEYEKLQWPAYAQRILKVTEVEAYFP